MTNQNHRPLPANVANVFSEPVLPVEVLALSPLPGTIWEVSSTYGELQLVVIVEQFDSDVAAPIAFVRAIPLTWFLGTNGPGDVVVVVSPCDELFSAHCWLEGPISESSLLRCIGTISTDSLCTINKLRDVSEPERQPQEVWLFRQSLREQFDVVFTKCWRDIYDRLDKELELNVRAASRKTSVRIQNWLDNVSAADEASRLAASGSISSFDELRTFRVADDPSTLVDVTANEKRVLTFLLRRSNSKRLQKHPLDIYVRIVATDAKGNKISSALSVLPAAVVLPENFCVESLSLVSRADQTEHALLDLET